MGPAKLDHSIHGLKHNQSTESTHRFDFWNSFFFIQHIKNNLVVTFIFILVTIIDIFDDYLDTTGPKSHRFVTTVRNGNDS